MIFRVHGKEKFLILQKAPCCQRCRFLLMSTAENDAAIVSILVAFSPCSAPPPSKHANCLNIYGIVLRGDALPCHRQLNCHRLLVLPPALLHYRVMTSRLLVATPAVCRFPQISLRRNYSFSADSARGCTHIEYASPGVDKFCKIQ